MFDATTSAVEVLALTVAAGADGGGVIASVVVASAEIPPLVLDAVVTTMIVEGSVDEAAWGSAVLRSESPVTADWPLYASCTVTLPAS